MDYSQFPLDVIDENVDYSAHEIKNIIKKYGPRESGSEAAYNTEKHLKKEFDQFADSAEFEEYKLAPKALLSFTKTFGWLTVVAVVACLALVFLNVISFFLAQCITGLVAALSLLAALLEYYMKKKPFDFLHKKVTGHNLVAVRKPGGEVKKRVIISGNIDGAYENRLTLYLKGGLKLFTTGSGICYVISFIIAIINVIANYADLGSFGEFMLSYSYYFHCVTALFAIGLIWAVNFGKVSPGAVSGLSGAYAAVSVLRALDMAGAELQQTEVDAFINDGKEAGLRGAEAYAKAHKPELSGNVETAVICVDSVSDGNLNIYTKDLSGGVKNSKKLADLVLEGANDAGLSDAKESSSVFGATDAAAFSQLGIDAVSIGTLNPYTSDFYHNRKDNFDALNKDALRAVYSAVIASVLKFDADN